MFRIIKFKSVETLNFITGKGTDHSNQEGNTKIKLSYAFQCFSPGVEIRIFIQFGTAIHVFLKLLVCSVNNDILLILVAFIILQMSDFLRLALDVNYVFKRYGHNTRKTQPKQNTTKNRSLSIENLTRIEKIVCLFGQF